MEPSTPSSAPETDERFLLERARSGDRDALETLLLRYQDKIYGYGMRMCRKPSDAEEVLQDTLLAAAKSIGDFRGEGAFAGWLYRIAHSFCVKRRRKGKFAPEREESLNETRQFQNFPDAGLGPDEDLTRRELAVALNQAISLLPNQFREVFLLRDIEGLSTEETARVLGLRLATVKTRLHRARTAIRNALSPFFDQSSATAAQPAGCPDVALLLSRHLEGELSPRVCARMERHLERCQHCRGTCESLRQLLALCKTQPRTRVPPDLQDKLRKALRELAMSPKAPMGKPQL